MSKPHFTTTGVAPRIVRFEAFAFHDSKGRIHHMHHSIVLEGGEPRPVEQTLEEVREHARTLGNDVSNLQVLHVKESFNPAVPHRVDVERGVLVELAPPMQTPNVRDATVKKARRKPARKAAKKSAKRPRRKR